MTLCVVLDGWHKGHVVPLPSAPPILRLYRPKVATWCTCNPDGEPEPFMSDADVVEYRRCMAGTDWNVAAYSLKGNSDALINGRDWVQRADVGMLVEPRPIYWDHVLDVGCRDEKAWP